MYRALFFLAATFHLFNLALGADPGTSGLWAGDDSRLIFSEDFEQIDPTTLPAGYRLVNDPQRDRGQVLTATITKPNEYRRLEIPFSHLEGRKLELSFFARSPDQARCAIWVRQDGKKRFSPLQIDRLPKKWTRFTTTASIPDGGTGAVEIVLPSSYNAPPGTGFLDNVELTASAATEISLESPEDFPVLCHDAQQGAWLAVTRRPGNTPLLSVARILDSRREEAIVFQPRGMTGIGMPAIACWSAGCVVAVPIERDHRWQIACLFVDRDRRQPAAVHYLDAGGNANIDPAVDVRGDEAVVVWEGNRDWPRQIYAATVRPERQTREVRAISGGELPASNPDVVLLGGGRGLAAWDAYDGESVNLYGCFLEHGAWQDVQRITRDARLERHVDLAAHDGQIWLAWQAQSFAQHGINRLSQQRIVVARISDEGLKSLPGFFQSVSTPRQLLVRPQLAFAGDGALAISARRSLGPHSGWSAVAWTYDGKSISEPIELWSGQGRWRPASMAMHGDALVAAVQRDNLPTNWGIDVGEAPDWKSDVVLLKLPETRRKPPIDASDNTIPLVMPATEFDLSNHTASFSASLPDQTATLGNRKLRLYWGDMHEHSDLSVCQRSQNPPIDDLWANQRDIEKLDFTAITDHGYNLDHPQWAFSAERVRAHFDPHRFVSLLAEEWTSDHIHYTPRRSVRRYGHHNLVFRDPYYPRWYDSRDDSAPTPRDVWTAIGDAEFISIPHQLADTGNSPTDWTYHDEHHQPLAEIFQQRESYEYFGAPRQSKTATPFKGHYLQDAWALGLIIGVIASPDHGGGKGKAGVWAESLTPDSLFSAFHARHTFGTSGAKMSLLVSSGQSMMGDKILHPKTKVPLRIEATADRPITRVVILRNNEEVFSTEPNSANVDVSWEDADADAEQRLWYYVRIHRDDDELAWSSPIWFFPDRATLEGTADFARHLPHLHAEGPPADDPGPDVNWRAKLKKRY